MKKILLVLILLCAFIAVHADETDEFNSAKRDFDYIEHSDKVSRRSYLIVADKFYRVYAASPRSSVADEALHYSAQTYYRSYSRYNNQDDLLKALKNLRVLSANYDTRLASLAYLQTAKIYEQQRDFVSAQITLKKLLARFPNYDEAKEAKDMLAEINSTYGQKAYASAAKKPVLKPKPPIMKPAAAPSPKTDAAPLPRVPAKQYTPPAKSYSAPVASVSYKKDQMKIQDNDTADNATTSKQVAYGNISTPSSVPDGKAAIKRIRYFTTPDYTRVVLDMSGKAEINKHWLKADPANGKPPRLFIDLENVVVSGEIPQDIEIKDGLLRSLRWAYNRTNVARIVLDSDNVQDFTVFSMTDPERVVIDVSSSASVGGASQPDQPVQVKAEPKSNEQVAKAGNYANLQKSSGASDTLAGVFGLKIKSIVIDPGHGGKDPGASYFGVQEKDVVLDAGLELYRLIKEYNPDIDVYMTRNTDVFIPLEERTAFANRKKADLFVSIHVNAAPNATAKGIETFVLNVTNDKKALQVAAFENQTTQKSMSDLQGILKDIMLNSKLEESLQLASYVQKNITGELYGSDAGRLSLGVKQAPFYVLVGAKMPSILVETGFVSNKDEASNLATEKYRKEMAKGIYDGIMSYIKLMNGK